MQAIKDKLADMNSMRKAKAEAKAEEKAEKEYAKARSQVAHEVRLAKEAEAEMDMHVAKAQQLAEKEMAKHQHGQPHHVDDGTSHPPHTIGSRNTNVAAGNVNAPAGHQLL